MMARCLTLVVFVLVSFAGFAQDIAGSTSPDDLTKAQQLANAADKTEAINLYNKLIKNNSACGECYLGLAMIYFKRGSARGGQPGDLPAAFENTQKVIKFVPDRTLQTKAHYLASLVLAEWGATKPEKYKDAEQELRAVMAMLPADKDMCYTLGLLLMKQKPPRDQEGKAELQKFLDTLPKNATKDQIKKADFALRAIANPRVVREDYAPDFLLTSTDEKQIALEELRGKVAVLCFYMMTSQPFLDNISQLNKTVAKFSDEPVVFVGVSLDQPKDDEKWRALIQQKKMTWPQCRAAWALSSQFGVQVYPSIVLIDHEGIIGTACCQTRLTASRTA